MKWPLQFPSTFLLCHWNTFPKYCASLVNKHTKHKNGHIHPNLVRSNNKHYYRFTWQSVLVNVGTFFSVSHKKYLSWVSISTQREKYWQRTFLLTRATDDDQKLFSGAHDRFAFLAACVSVCSVHILLGQGNSNAMNKISVPRHMTVKGFRRVTLSAVMLSTLTAWCISAIMCTIFLMSKWQPD